jgi:hypothetical protein
MAVITEDIIRNPADRHFLECLATGDDFNKIEIYWQAVNWYRKAAELRPESQEARQKLEECIAKKKAESKAIIYLLITTVVIIGILLIVLR